VSSPTCDNTNDAESGRVDETHGHVKKHAVVLDRYVLSSITQT